MKLGTGRVALAFGLASTAALAADRFDHQGSIGLLLAPGMALTIDAGLIAVPDISARWLGLVGGSIAFDESGNEIVLLGRFTGRTGAFDAAALVGYRGYFGYDQLKTFFDLDLALLISPALLAGPRVGVGIQYELTPVIGAYCAAGLQLGLGTALLFTGDVSCGVQLRSYLLD